MHILSGKLKCIDRSTSRERDMCSFLNIVIFLTLRTRLRISKFRVYLCKNSDRPDVLESLYYIINGFCTDGEQAKVFWFSEGRTKV